jgi:DNA-binding transcriptional LysR family regulator
MRRGRRVRLIQRSTRRFAVTEIGREYYHHCVAMMVEAEAAQDTIDRIRSEPQGVVRVSCPLSLIYFEVGEMITRFMVEYPKVKVLLESTNRRVDVIRTSRRRPSTSGRPRTARPAFMGCRVTSCG